MRGLAALSGRILSLLTDPEMHGQDALELYSSAASAGLALLPKAVSTLPSVLKLGSRLPAAAKAELKAARRPSGNSPMC
jgi:hypothetical protein